MWLWLMISLGWRCCCLIFQKFISFLFFLPFFWALGIQAAHSRFFFRSELRQGTNEIDQLPTVFVCLTCRSPRRHSSQPNAIFDRVIDLAIGQFLGIG